MVDQETGQERWVDATCIHPTCKSRITKEWAQVRKRIEKLEARWNGEADIVINYEEGKALQDQRNKKHGVYAPLITIAEKQLIDGKRLTKPTFITAAMSTAGEMGLETIQLQEWLTASYARMLGTLPKRDDDIGIKKLTADFRNRYRNRIAVAVARGQAQMCLSAGLPATSCKKYREQACG